MKLFSKSLLMNKKIEPTPTDENTILLLHGEDFIDSSKNNLEVLHNGITIVERDDTFNKCFYNSLRGSSTNYIEVNLPDSWGKTFTIDFWLHMLSYPNATYKFVVPFAVGDYRDGVFLQLQYSSRLTALWVANTYNTIPLTDIPLNEWIHLAITYDGSAYKLYINGSLKITCESNVYTERTNLNLFRSGGSATFGRGARCYIDEVRVSDIVRWTENFTPPTKPY